MSRLSRLPALVAAVTVLASLSAPNPANASPATKAAAAQPAPWTKDDLQAAKMLRDRLAKGSEAFPFVRDLTTEVGPRSAGSAGDAAAVSWARARLEALGFDRVYTQEVNVPHWDRGELEVRTEAPFPQRLVAASLGGSIGTAQEGLHGEVVRFDSLEALKAAPDTAVAGRIVFLDQTMLRDREGKGYGPTVRGRADGASLA
ncbi:MAG: Aminopeptidase YwaD precursor, partial [Pseudomonadota bacterium]